MGDRSIIISNAAGVGYGGLAGMESIEASSTPAGEFTTELSVGGSSVYLKPDDAERVAPFLADENGRTVRVVVTKDPLEAISDAVGEWATEARDWLRRKGQAIRESVKSAVSTDRTSRGPEETR